ncbi:MAG TPA: tetratricopeptide repeat protein [Bryobacteraceae bacterium]|nr:tetratricopeptide repeat protein [Bryobacteraceae bacterium]
MMRWGGKRWVCALAWLAIAAPACGAATFDELAGLAAAAREADRVPQAINLYRQALQLKPDWSEGWFYLGTLYYDSDRYADAQPAFAQFVKLADKPAGWAFLGLCEFETGGYAQARQHLQKALDGGLAPEIEAVVRFHQTLLLTRLGLFDQALYWYKALVSGGIHDPALIAGLGLNSLSKPMLPAETPPERREFIAAVGRTAYVWLSGDNAKTEAAFRALLEAYPSAPGVHNLYARYLLTSRPDAAMPELRRELELDPQSVEASAMLALLLLQAGQRSDASSYAQKAAADGPSSALAQYACGSVLADIDPKEAARHLETAARLDPSNVEYHATLAHLYSRSGRNDDARRERKIAIRLARQAGSSGPS